MVEWSSFVRVGPNLAQFCFLSGHFVILPDLTHCVRRIGHHWWWTASKRSPGLQLKWKWIYVLRKNIHLGIKGRYSYYTAMDESVQTLWSFCVCLCLYVCYYSGQKGWLRMGTPDSLALATGSFSFLPISFIPLSLSWRSTSVKCVGANNYI